MQSEKKFVLSHIEAGAAPESQELAMVILGRMGLLPRKKGATEEMHKVLLQLYERSKLAAREKKPEMAVCTVEEMGFFAGISRQTMYEYLERWLELELITKTSYIRGPSVIIGYKLNGPTLEAAFEKAVQRVNNHMDLTLEYVRRLQKSVKNEKLSSIMGRGTSAPEDLPVDPTNKPAQITEKPVESHETLLQDSQRTLL